MKSRAKRSGPELARKITQGAFVVWVIVVNVLYYVQFKPIFVSRVVPFLHRWH